MLRSFVLQNYRANTHIDSLCTLRFFKALELTIDGTTWFDYRRYEGGWFNFQTFDFIGMRQRNMLQAPSCITRLQANSSSGKLT